MSQAMRMTSYDDTVNIAGIPTFFRAPYVPPELEKLKEFGTTVGIMGVPYEGGNAARPGSSYGPHAVRTAMWQPSSYLFDLDIDLFDVYRISDCGDIPVNPVNVQKAHRTIANYSNILHEAGALPILIGGDHSITTGGVMSLSEVTAGSIGLLILDAHLDTSESIGGEIDSEASFITSLINRLPNLDGRNLAVVGVRGASCPRSRWDFVRKSGMTVISMEEVQDTGVKAAIEKGLSIVKSGTKAFYVSYDIDAIDPAYAPGTTGPEPGGFTSREILQATRLIGRAQPAAFDVVEICMCYDPSGTTAIMAAYLMIHTLAARGKVT